MNTAFYHAVKAGVACLLCANVYGQITLDADGVQMLLPSATGGSSLLLDTQNPNTFIQTGFDYKAQATRGTHSSTVGLLYWSLPSSPLNYSSGGTGYTARLHLYASGGKQNFNWKTQQGYLSSPADVRDQEFTVYLRVHELLTPRIAQATLKIRGGSHSPNDPDASSSTMMTFSPESNKTITRFGKELSHPLYDYVVLRPEFTATLQENQWVGMKLLSWTDPKNASRVINQLHIDTVPFDAAGKPANNWKLFSEYVDVEGKSTGHYSRLADWGGWQTTLRVDGYRSIDFAYPSVREIVPKSAP